LFACLGCRLQRSHSSELPSWSLTPGESWVSFYCLLPGSNHAAKNAIVSWDATTFHHNVTVVDWASVIAPHPEDFVPDGVHYTPAGYWPRAQTIVAAVGP
jgi:hypothetical protein